MGEAASQEIQILAKGPLMTAQQYNSYIINGFSFIHNPMMRIGQFKVAV
jgi:hypothetical protein